MSNMANGQYVFVDPSSNLAVQFDGTSFNPRTSIGFGDNLANTIINGGNGIVISNGTTTTGISPPTVDQYSGNYFLHANGSWVLIVSGGGGSDANTAYANAVIYANTVAGTAYTNAIAAVPNLTANNTTHAFGKLEAGLNANSALTANSSTYLGTKLEGALNANSALTANNAAFLNGKIESGINANSALTANSSTYLGTKLEGALNANSALTANSSTYLGTKLEAGINANSALTANSAAYLGSTIASGYQTTASLSSSVATLTANNATYLNGQLASYYTAINTRLGYTAANKAGDVFGGAITVNGTVYANTGTIYVQNYGATAGVGIVYFGTSGSYYIYNNATNFIYNSPNHHYFNNNIYASGSGQITGDFQSGAGGTSLSQLTVAGGTSGSSGGARFNISGTPTWIWGHRSAIYGGSYNGNLVLYNTSVGAAFEMSTTNVATFYGQMYFANGLWCRSADGFARWMYGSGTSTYLSGGNSADWVIQFSPNDAGTLSIFNGDGNWYTSAGGFYGGWSDRRLKKDLTPVVDWKTFLNDCTSYRFHWNELGKKVHGIETQGDWELGLVAQDVMKTIPEAVFIQQGQYKEKGVPKDDIDYDPENPYRSIDYDKVVVYLFEAVKAAHMEIELLKKRLEGK